MKKILNILIIVLSIFCVGVNAEDSDLKIKSIDVISKSENLEDVESSYDNLSGKINLNMYEVGDFIKYKIELENNKDSSASIDLNDLNINDIKEEKSKWCEYVDWGNDYIENSCDFGYSFETEDSCNSALKEDYEYELEEMGDSIYCKKEITYSSGDYLTYEVTGDTTIKENSTGVIYLTIKYTKEREICDDFTDSQKINLKYSFNETVKNPETNSTLFIIIGLSIILVLLIFGNKFKNSKLICTLVIALLLIPYITSAENNNYITLNTNVKLNCDYSFNLSDCNTGDTTKFKYNSNDTFRSWASSKYNFTEIDSTLLQNNIYCDESYGYKIFYVSDMNRELDPDDSIINGENYCYIYYNNY